METAIIQKMQKQISDLEANQRRMASFTQNATIALGVQTYTVADLPVLTTTGGCQIAFASNGRNPAEGVGAGTGVICFNTGSGGWRRVADGAVVSA